MKYILLLSISICVQTSIYAASPSVAGILPRGGQRGTDVAVTFAGSNLADVAEVFAFYPGITVTDLKVVSPSVAMATFKIAPDCRLGEHIFRVRTASGISDARTFWVGALPSVDEKEPNNDFAAPQAIPLNCTVHGIIQSEDVDYFSVECKKGQRLSVEIEGMRLGGAFFDPYVAILNDKRFELAVGDDSPLTGQDGGCSIVVPADGKYIVQVRESAYGGNGNCHYRLHVGNFPRPTGVVPAGGKPGEELEVRFLGDLLGEIKQKIKIPADVLPDDPLFRIHCQSADGVHPAGIRFQIADVPNTVDIPAATTLAAAVSGPAPGAFNGVISKPGETKYFKFAAKKGQIFAINCTARGLGSPLDPVLYLGKANGQLITSNDDSGSPDSSLRYIFPEDGEYVTWVHDHLHKGGPDYFFRIQILNVMAGTRVGLAKTDGNNAANQNRQTASVPRGGRVALQVSFNRIDWGGPATVAFDKLPPGVTMSAPPIDAGQSLVPVVLEAAADAPLGGLLADLRIVPAEPHPKVPSLTSIDVNYNLGNNNTVYHRHITHRVAVAVVEAAPFSVDVVIPKVPVVQNGSMNLKVIAKRSPNFKGPISVLPAYTPPGVGIIGTTVIPENATECNIIIGTNGGTAAKVYPTAFMAVANPGQGDIWVGTSLVNLEVAPPFLTLQQERAFVEVGQKTHVVCKVNHLAPFEGTATATLLGLIAKTTAAPVEFTKDAKEISFDLVTATGAPTGKHNLFIQVVVVKNGEPVVHSTGGGELRIDAPLPPKAAVAAAPAKKEEPKPAPAPTAKRLSRLEQLRQEQEEREKAARGPEKK